MRLHILACLGQVAEGWREGELHHLTFHILHQEKDNEARSRNYSKDFPMCQNFTLTQLLMVFERASEVNPDHFQNGMVLYILLCTRNWILKYRCKAIKKIRNDPHMWIWASQVSWCPLGSGLDTSKDYHMKKEIYLTLSVRFVCQCPRKAENLVLNQCVKCPIRSSLHWAVLLGQRVTQLTEFSLRNTHQQLKGHPSAGLLHYLSMLPATGDGQCLWRIHISTLQINSL